MPAALSFLLRRVATAVALLLALSFMTFFVFVQIPADPVAWLVNPHKASPKEVAQARHQLGIDKPMHVQYERYVRRLLHGDLGTSWQTVSLNNTGVEVGVPVRTLLVRAASVTGSLALGGALMLLLVALPLGMLSASRPNSVLDRSAVTLSVVGISTHPLVIALILQLFLGERWHALPPRGYCTFMPKHYPPTTDPTFVGPCAGPGQWAYHLLLPWLAFALFFVAIYMRMVRTRMLEVLNEPYVRTARAKGASELRVLWRHALPNAVLPVLGMVGMDIGTAVGIAVYIETVYGLPGVGLALVRALQGEVGFDLPMIAGIVLFTATAIVVINLVIDVVSLVIDPTISQVPTRRARLQHVFGRAA